MLPWAHSGYLKLDHPHRLLVLLQTGIIVINNHSMGKHFLRTGTFCLPPPPLLTLSWADGVGAGYVWVAVAAAHHKAGQPTRARSHYYSPAHTAAAPSCHRDGGVGYLHAQ